MFSAALAAFLSLFLFCTQVVVASPWVVTSYYQKMVSTYDDGYTYTRASTTIIEPEDLVTKLVNVQPTVTAVPTLSVATTVDDYYSEVTVVNVLVPTNVGKPITYDYYASTTTTSYYGYYVKLSYTASSSCDPRWVFTTSANAYLPPMITPTPTSVSTRFTQREAFGPTSTYYYAFIDPAILPTSSLSSIKSVYAPYFTRSCTVPSSYQTGLVSPGEGDSDSGSNGSGSGSSNDDGVTGPDANGVTCRPAGSGSYDDDGYYRSSSYYSDYYGDGYRTLMVCSDGTTYWTKPVSLVTLIAITVVLGWFGLFLIIGLIESWIHFSRLARGRAARRGLPMAFAALAPFLSCFFLFCHIRGFNARSEEDQVTMTADWKATGFFTKLGRWIVWGFRYKYPTFLGTAPTRRKKWDEKGESRITPNAANAPIGPQPPPGTMYVVANPADPNQRMSVYPPPQAGQAGPPGPPPGGWYAPAPVDGQPQQPYMMPMAYQQQGTPPPQGAYQQGGGPPLPQQMYQPGGGSPQLPPRAHIAEDGAARGVGSVSGPSTGSPVSAVAGVAGAVPGAGGSPVPQTRGVEVEGSSVGGGGSEVGGGVVGGSGGGPPVPGPGFEPGTGDGTIHEAPAGDVRGDAVVADKGASVVGDAPK